MCITTAPSMFITLVIFMVAGFMYDATATTQVTVYAAVLKETFHISWWLLIVPVVTVALIIKRVPSLVVLFLSAALAGVVALIAQPHLLHEITGNGAQGFASSVKGLWMMFYDTTNIDTGNASLNGLVATRGMAGMMDTIWLILCAMAFGGAMTASGMLKSITSVFLRFMKRRASMVGTTVMSGIFLNLITADQYIAIILSGNMFKDAYRKKGYENRLLSRTIEDAATVTSPLIPWNTCGLTQATILGVSTFVYFPYCFFNLISPLMSIAIAALGYKIPTTTQPQPFR
jgi:NhaC family Na+:H+ antiporter